MIRSRLLFPPFFTIVRVGMVFMAVLSCCATNAAVVVADDPVFGAGSITIDTESGLEWLDFNITAGLSVDDVTAEFAVGGDFFGWRHATIAETKFFFESLGLATDNFPQSSLIHDNGAAAELAGSIAGFTVTFPPGSQFRSYTQAITGDIAPGMPNERLAVQFTTANFGGDFRSSTFFDFTRPTDESVGNWSQALVRASVPEPSSLLLIVLASAGLLRHRRW